jgi:hypothetical protein
VSRDRVRAKHRELFNVHWKRGRVGVTDVQRAVLEFVADFDCEGETNTVPRNPCRRADVRICAPCAARALLGRAMDEVQS